MKLSTSATVPLLRLQFLYLSFLILFSSIVMPATSAQDHPQRTILVGAFDYYPSIFKDEDGDIKGIFVDLLDTIAKTHNWTINYVFGSWSDGLDRIRNGKVDLLTSVAFTPERDKFLAYGSVPLNTVWSQVYVHQTSSIGSILDLADKKIALMKGDFNGAQFSSITGQFRISCQFASSPDFNTVFSKIEAGEVDAGVVNSMFGAASMEQYNVKPTDIVFNPFDIFFATAHNRNHDVLSALDSTLKMWRTDKNSPYQQLTQRWTHGRIQQITVIPRWLRTGIIAISLIVGILVLFTITLQLQVKRATRTILMGEQKLRVIIDSIGDGLFVHDALTGAIIMVNRRTERLFGYTEQELVTLSVEDLSAADEGFTQKRALELFNNARAGTPLQVTWRSKPKNGPLFWTEINITAATLGGIESVLVLVHDITDRKKSEESQLKIEKLESIGILAGGIAHDFNNLLGGIYGYLDMVEESLVNKDIEEASENLNKTFKIFERTKALTRQLLTFSKGGTPVMQQGAQLPELIKDTAEFVLSGSKVRVEYRFDEKLPPCAFDQNQICQVFDNLIINATQAMPDGGQITISADTQHIGPGEHPVLTSGTYTRIRVDDEGCGIPQDALASIFDPFFTTKATGNGLGLATTWSIINRHGGHIDVESEVGRGTSFIISLPEAKSRLLSPVKQVELSAEAGFEGYRVLVMDDEEYNRDFIRAQIISAGYDAAAVVNGDEAVTHHKNAIESGNPFKLLILDLTIPGAMGGMEAAKIIRRKDSDVMIVAMSGYTTSPAMSDPQSYGFTASLAKPFRISELITLMKTRNAKE